jgi:hypothetical protein
MYIFVRKKLSNKSAKNWVSKLPHLRKVRKCNKFCQSANLRLCNLRNLFADRPPLNFIDLLIY